MRILSRRFLASYLSLFFATFLTMTTLVIVVETLVDFDKIVEHRKAAGGTIAYLLVRIPSLYFRDVVPLASFTAAFLCLGGAARAHEVVAAKAGGIPPIRLAIPPLVAATVLSAVTLVFNETWLLNASQTFQSIHSSGNHLAYGNGSFWYHKGRSFYNIRESDRRTRTLRGVTVYTLDPRGRLVESLSAETVELQTNSRWLAPSAERRIFDPENATALPQIEKLDSMVIDTGSRDALAMVDAGENALSLTELRDVIETREEEGRNAQRFRAMLHTRLAMPLWVMVFALLAIPVGLSVERTRSLAVSAIIGVSLLALFHALWRTGTLFASSGFETATFSPWAVVALFTLLGGVLLVRSPS